MNSTSESGINSMVCETCRDNLFNTKSFQEAWEKDVTYNTNWANIRQSYNKGCSWCDLVYYQVAKDLATMDDPLQTFFQGSRELIRAHARSIRKDEMIVFVTFQNQSSERGDDAILLLGTRNSSRIFQRCATLGGARAKFAQC